MLSCFAPFGRMALTNYIMQSVILVVIFHGYALGYFGQVSRASQMLIVRCDRRVVRCCCRRGG